ncbi:MAG TPA: hemerythrin domain-containing protein [Steroidobacteraceae bacterium]|nr:hemerythrin domain-containing protein [Steroidobacteraceae bacterium]
MKTGSKTISKAAGKAKGATKALTGYPGIFHHLAGEHAEVAVLMNRLAAGDGKTRAELLPELKRNLLAHAHGEEQVFYPEVRRFPELQALVTRCLEDHQQIERQLARLESMDTSSPGWGDSLQELKEAVETHVEREEDEVFPVAADLLEAGQAKDLEERYESVEEREKAKM